MTKRQAATPAPGPLEAYAAEFDDLFERRNAREAFRRYLEGLLLPAERNKTLTALANAEPIIGAQQPRVQSLQWFLSESTWDAAALNTRRIQLLRRDPATAPDADGVLVIDETGDRKWGTKTAHIGRQYLGSIGKVDRGVVTVSSLWADERVYWPLAVEPFTPKQHFPRGMSDPAYRTKPQIALKLVQQAVVDGIPFRAVVATTDPATLPEHTTWYLLTNLPAPDTPRAQDEPLLVADLAAVVRLYGLRNWVEQSYKQVKQSLGWRAYQVRSDRAMRRHWALVCCAFSFCWWTGGEDAPPVPLPEEEPAARGENRRRHGRRHPAGRKLAGPAAAGAGLAGAVGHAQTLLAGVVDCAPTAGCAGAAELARRGPADHPL